MNTLEIIATTNQTLTASIFPIGSDIAIASGVSLTEYANTKSVYYGTFSSSANGKHRVIVFDGVNPVGITDIDLSGANTDFLYASATTTSIDIRNAIGLSNNNLDTQLLNIKTDTNKLQPLSMEL